MEALVNRSHTHRFSTTDVNVGKKLVIQPRMRRRKRRNVFDDLYYGKKKQENTIQERNDTIEEEDDEDEVQELNFQAYDASKWRQMSKSPEDHLGKSMSMGLSNLIKAEALKKTDEEVRLINNPNADLP